jgi:purine-nucleoside phosphorylase
VEVLKDRLGDVVPRAALVLGSGLGTLGDRVQNAQRIAYSDLPGFPAPGVAGHKAELVAGTLAGVEVIVQCGRFHLYEGHALETVALPIRLFHSLGSETLVLTNAAGGVRPTFRPGTLMLIADHINLMWRNPLLGPVPPGEERFPDMSEPYDEALRAIARAAARDARIPLEEGVYAGMLGPSYETPAEIRMLARLGADAVGMSTVPEVLVARASGMRCVGFSVITNAAAGLTGVGAQHAAPVHHDDVLALGQRAAGQLAAVVEAVLRGL